MYQNKNVYKSFIVGLALASLIENSDSLVRFKSKQRNTFSPIIGKLGYVSADIGLNNTRMTVSLRCNTPLVGLHATSHHKSVGQTSKRLNRSTDWTSNIIYGDIVVGWITEKGAFADAQGYIYWRPKSQLICTYEWWEQWGFRKKRHWIECRSIQSRIIIDLGKVAENMNWWWRMTIFALNTIKLLTHSDYASNQIGSKVHHWRAKA